MALRVAHCGTGRTGREALRAIIEDPALELVGQYVSTPEKVGCDAGDLCGLPATGVLATGDLDDVIDLQADCFCYAGNVVGREREAVEEIARFLRAGTNVVSFAVVSLTYPPTSPPELRELIDAACAAGGTSFYASGTDPGALAMNVPASLLSMAGQVTRYRMQLFAMDIATAYPVSDVLRGSMGFGMPDGTTPPRVLGGVVERDWTPDVRFIADLMRCSLDGIALEWETACASADLETPIGTIEAGTIAAYRWELSGHVAGRPVVSVEYVATVTGDAPMPDGWARLPEGVRSGIAYVIEGRPGFRAIVSVDPMPDELLNGSIPMTALAVTNAIPAVVAAPPGHLSPTDLGFYATRRTG